MQLSPHIPHSADSQPTLQELQALLHNGEQINIIKTIAAKWRAVGIALCLNRHRNDIIQSDARTPYLPTRLRRRVWPCCSAGWGGRGATWRALIRALEDVDENVLASQLTLSDNNIMMYIHCINVNRQT